MIREFFSPVTSSRYSQALFVKTGKEVKVDKVFIWGISLSCLLFTCHPF